MKIAHLTQLEMNARLLLLLNEQFSTAFMWDVYVGVEWEIKENRRKNLICKVRNRLNFFEKLKTRLTPSLLIEMLLHLKLISGRHKITQVIKSYENTCQKASTLECRHKQQKANACNVKDNRCFVLSFKERRMEIFLTRMLRHYHDYVLRKIVANVEGADVKFSK